MLKKDILYQSAVMKKITCSLALLMLLWAFFAAPVTAQKFELIPFAGYETGANIKSYAGQFHINGGADFGASLSYRFSEFYRIEVSYSRLSSDLSYTPDTSTSTPVGNLALTYFSVGGVAEINPRNTTVPFFKIALGGTFYSPSDTAITSANVMHFDISGGVKFNVSEHIGFRLQASLLLPIFFEGMYFEEAAPDPGQGMQTKISGVQGNFTGGLIVRF
jgi:hypothetical protein